MSCIIEILKIKPFYWKKLNIYLIQISIIRKLKLIERHRMSLNELSKIMLCLNDDENAYFQHFGT